jgi:ubiquinone/menaquinone biosynthesis C-methylase UbiE
MLADSARNIAQHASAVRPLRVLEVAAGTGIVTRRLRDLFPPSAYLTGTELNLPMFDVARKMRRGARP